MDTTVLPKCVDFIDGTVIDVTWSSWSHMMQMVASNGHKRKYGLKCQPVIGPDGLLLHPFGPIEARRHEWTLWCRSDTQEKLPQVLDVNSVQFCLYEDSATIGGGTWRYYIRIFVCKHSSKHSVKAWQKIDFQLNGDSNRKSYFCSVDFKRKMNHLSLQQAPLIYALCCFPTSELFYTMNKQRCTLSISHLR